MKKIIIVLLAGIILLNLTSCETVDMDYSYTIKDALKISTYLFDESSGENYFIYNRLGNYEYNFHENIHMLERLKMNEVRLMSPINFSGLELNIHFEFNGIIEVISEDKDVHMVINPNNLNEPIIVFTYDEPRGFEMKFPFEGFIAVCPLGLSSGSQWFYDAIPRSSSYTGREYYLNVNAYKFDNEETPIIRAQIKLVQLEDKTPIDNAKLSGCFSIELISYDYSDIYKLLDEIVEDNWE